MRTAAQRAVSNTNSDAWGQLEPRFSTWTGIFALFVPQFEIDTPCFVFLFLALFGLFVGTSCCGLIEANESILSGFFVEMNLLFFDWQFLQKRAVLQIRANHCVNWDLFFYLCLAVF